VHRDDACCDYLARCRAVIAGVSCRTGCRAGCGAGCRASCRVSCSAGCRLGGWDRAALLEVPRRLTAARPALHRHRHRFGQLVGEVRVGEVRVGEVRVGEVSVGEGGVDLASLARPMPMPVGKGGFYPLRRGGFYPL
jgi:hypothetical protein